MNKLFKHTLIMLALLQVACGPIDNNNQENEGNNRETESLEYYALRGADHSWPGEATQIMQLSENKTAKNYYVIFDGSGSMNDVSCGDGQRRIYAAKQSIKQFFTAVSKESNVGLFVFDNDGAREASAIAPLDMSKLNREIDLVNAGSGTPLGQSLRAAYQRLSEQGQKQQGYGEYNIVVITDGAASDTDEMNNMVKFVTANSPINLHTIGFCIQGGHALNREGTINYRSASNITELTQGLQAVLAEAESFDTVSFSGDNQ